MAGIMVNGQFQCLGSIQHLKNRFGSGYSLTVRCQEARVGEVQRRMGELMPDAEILESHHTQLKYQLPIQSTRLPLVFRHMEDLRTIIEDYSLTQTTLDEVFVQFASKQTELQEDEVKEKSLKQKILRKLKKSHAENV